MTVLEYIIGGVLLVLAIALIALIGLQQSKRRGLGNSIAGQGASESYLAKNKIGGRDKSYQKLTLIIAIVFVVLILALYIIGSVDMTDGDDNSSAATSTTSTTSTVSNTASTAESSVAESSVADASAEESK